MIDKGCLTDDYNKGPLNGGFISGFHIGVYGTDTIVQNNSMDGIFFKH